MSDYNVLTYAKNEVGGETDIPRCINLAKSVYQKVKEKQIEASKIKKEPEKQLPVDGVKQIVEQDVENGRRPTMGERI